MGEFGEDAPDEYPDNVPMGDEDWFDTQPDTIPDHEGLIIRDEAEVAEAVNEVAESPETQALEQLFCYVEDSQLKAFTSFITTINEKTALSQKNLEDETSFEDLHKVIAEEHRVLSFRHTVDAHDFEPTLAYAGLAYKSNVFMPTVIIRDAGRFSEALGNIFTASPAILQGAERAVDNSLRDVASAYVPQLNSEEYWTFHTDPQQLAWMSDPAASQQYEAQKAQLLANAEDIAAHMAFLSTDSYTLDSLIVARDADAQGMLAEWAVAYHWGLYKPATTRDGDSYWTSWRTDEEWQMMFDFVGHAIEKTGAESPFVQHLAARLAENISCKRLGILTPATPSPLEIANMQSMGTAEETYASLSERMNTQFEKIEEQMSYDDRLSRAERWLRGLVR